MAETVLFVVATIAILGAFSALALERPERDDDTWTVNWPLLALSVAALALLVAIMLLAPGLVFFILFAFAVLGVLATFIGMERPAGRRWLPGWTLLVPSAATLAVLIAIMVISSSAP